MPSSDWKTYFNMECQRVKGQPEADVLAALESVLEKHDAPSGFDAAWVAGVATDVSRGMNYRIN